MKSFANLKIQLKIMSLLALLGLVTVGVAWLGGHLMTKADASYSELVTKTLPDSVKLARANRQATQMMYAGYRTVAYDGNSATARAAVDDEKAAYEKAAKILDDTISTEPALSNVLTPLRQSLDSLHETVAKAMEHGLRNENEQANAVLATADGRASEFTKKLVALNDSRVEEAAKTSTDLSNAASASKTMMLVTALGALTATLVLGAFVSKNQVAEPLGRLQDAMRALSSGNNSVDVPGSDRRDEVGAMAKSVLVFKEAALAQAEAAKLKELNDVAQKLVVDTLQDRLTRLAGGDLTATIDARFSPEYEGLKLNFNEAVAALRALSLRSWTAQKRSPPDLRRSLRLARISRVARKVQLQASRKPQLPSPR